MKIEIHNTVYDCANKIVNINKLSDLFLIIESYKDYEVTVKTKDKGIDIYVR